MLSNAPFDGASPGTLLQGAGTGLAAAQSRAQGWGPTMGTHDEDPRWGPTPSDEDRHSVAVSLPCDGQVSVWSFWLSPLPQAALRAQTGGTRWERGEVEPLGRGPQGLPAGTPGWVSPTLLFLAAGSFAASCWSPAGGGAGPVLLEPPCPGHFCQLQHSLRGACGGRLPRGIAPSGATALAQCHTWSLST